LGSDAVWFVGGCLTEELWTHVSVNKFCCSNWVSNHESSLTTYVFGAYSVDARHWTLSSHLASRTYTNRRTGLTFGDFCGIAESPLSTRYSAGVTFVRQSPVATVSNVCNVYSGVVATELCKELSLMIQPNVRSD
jgi:hypothetical protein